MVHFNGIIDLTDKGIGVTQYNGPYQLNGYKDEQKNSFNLITLN